MIFGAIKDDNMDGKIRVSIVATALDGHKNQSNTVLNMSSRLQSRGHTTPKDYSLTLMLIIQLVLSMELQL